MIKKTLKFKAAKLSHPEQLFEQIKVVGDYLAKRYNLPMDIDVLLGYDDFVNDNLNAKYTFSTKFETYTDKEELN